MNAILRCLIISVGIALIASCDSDGTPSDDMGDLVFDSIDDEQDVAEDVASDPVDGGEDDLDTPDAIDDADLSIACPSEELTRTERGIGYWNACPGAWVELLPRALVAGEWVGGGIDAPCTVNGFSVRCPAGPSGTVVAETLGQRSVVVRFEADQAVSVEALELSGPAWLEGATGWLSNGFQSWSQSGVVGIHAAPEERVLRAALLARGDTEVSRMGHELSWFYTAAGGGDEALFAGALSAEVFRPWIQLTRETGDLLRLRMVAGDSGESVDVAMGERIDSPHWRIEMGSDLEAMLGRYGDTLPQRILPPADAGWNSWYELWDDVDEAAVRANAALARSMLSSLVPDDAPPLRIVVDDGWQRMWGEWEPNEKFPSGLDGLATDLHADGFEVGVWLAPFLVDADSALVTDHPDWFVDDATYPHLANGPMMVLDVTHPDAQAHLRDVIGQIVGWGYDLLKIDFLFAGTWEGERYQDVTGMEAYNIGMRVIREAAGGDTVLLAVGAPPIASFVWADAWRIGGDIALEPFGASWFFVPSQARSIASRWHLCRAVLCDADPVLLRDLPRNEVEVGSWVVALAGGALFLSDDLRVLPEERQSWGLDETRVSFAIGGEPAVPEPFFPQDPPPTLTNAFLDHIRRQNDHVVPPVWRLPNGNRIAINFSDEPLEIESVNVPARSVVELEAR